MAQHLGYYNDPEDVKKLIGKTPDAIVRYYRRGYGAFHTNTVPFAFYPVQGLRPVTRGKTTYYVQKLVDRKHLDSPDNFIDIYVK